MTLPEQQSQAQDLHFQLQVHAASMFISSLPFSWTEKNIMRNGSAETAPYFLLLILDDDLKKTKLRNLISKEMIPPRKNEQK